MQLQPRPAPFVESPFMQMLQYRVLLIEDDEDDYYLTQDVIDSVDRVNYEVVWRKTFQDGLNTISTEEFDVALVDYRIGGENGIDFVLTAKAQSISVPMILLTGLRDREIDIAASEAGAFDYLNKDELTPGLVERTIRFAYAAAQSQKSLAEQSALLQATLDNTGSGIAAIDAKKNLVACNRLFNEFMMALLEDAMEMCAIEDSSRDDGEFFNMNLPKILEIIDHSHSENVEVQIKKGRTFKLSQNLSDEGGAVIIISDITEQKEYEQELKTAREAAESASRIKTTFLTTMSHELRTPLNAIIGFSEIIMSGDRDSLSDEDHLEYMNYIFGSGKSLLAIINEILEFTKTDILEKELEREEISVNRELEYCVQKLKHDAERSCVDVQLHYLVDDNSILAEIDAFRRMTINILSNAIKFTPEHGAVDIGCCLLDSGALQIAISDSGVGIPEEEINRIMQPFYQVASDMNRQYEGTGLGLTVASALAELHEATLAVESVVDQGTTVKIVFPSKYVVERLTNEPSNDGIFAQPA